MSSQLILLSLKASPPYLRMLSLYVCLGVGYTCLVCFTVMVGL